MAETSPLPDYEPMLSAYHAAFGVELRALIDALPIRPGDRVLDVACGDGAYTAMLADRVGPGGSVTAVDLSAAYLGLTREVASGKPGDRLFVRGKIERTPLAESAFDLVWCAQSLFSLPDPLESVSQMARLARPGGFVAVLEDDTLHHVLLPWPIEVELAVRAAELAWLADKTGHPRKFYVGRRLRGVFRAAGLVDCLVSTHAANRQAPLDAPSRAFLDAYLLDARKRASAYLDPELLGRLDRLIEPGSPDRLVDQADLVLTCIDHLVIGRKPSGPG